MSLAFNSDYVISHWDAVLEGAKRSGKSPSRKDWRITRDVWVADSDDEAYDKAVNGMLGRVWGDYLLPLFDQFQLLHVIKHDSSIPDSAVTPEYMAEHVWLIGSPDTVEKKILSLYEMCGGFGTLLSLVYDNMDDQEDWEKSMKLLAKEVMPRFAGMNPE